MAMRTATRTRPASDRPAWPIGNDAIEDRAGLSSGGEGGPSGGEAGQPGGAGGGASGGTGGDDCTGIADANALRQCGQVGPMSTASAAQQCGHLVGRIVCTVSLHDQRIERPGPRPHHNGAPRPVYDLSARAPGGPEETANRWGGLRRKARKRRL
jgi:hypothetical protein